MPPDRRARPRSALRAPRSGPWLADASAVRRSGASSVEHHRLAGVREDPILEVPADGVREHPLLEVLALAHEVVDRIAMRAPDRGLLDDRPLIEIRRHVV